MENDDVIKIEVREYMETHSLSELIELFAYILKVYIED